MHAFSAFVLLGWLLERYSDYKKLELTLQWSKEHWLVPTIGRCGEYTVTKLPER